MDKLAQFQLYLLREGLAPGTIEKDITILKRLMQLEVLAGDKIDGYLLSQLQKGRAPGYLNNIVKACHTWGKFIDDPTLQHLKFFKVKENNKGILSEEEITSFLTLPKPKQTKPERYIMWNLIFLIMSRSGMRPGEVCSLTIPQVDFGRRVFILDHTKTRPRLVPMAKILIPVLRGYIKTLIKNELFLLDGKAIYKEQWNGHFQMRIMRLGIKRPHISTYSLRHSFATRMIGEIDLMVLQKILGHKDIQTTVQYIHLNTKDMIIAIDKDPIGRTDLPYQERFLQFREQVRKLLENLAFSVDEENRMLRDLLRL